MGPVSSPVDPPGGTPEPRGTPELALPVSFEAHYGQGVDRGLCLGGGGLFFVAWQLGYLQTLASRGVRLAGADRLVGTSAGSMVAAGLASGRLKWMHTEFSLLARLPALVSAMAPTSTLRPSQQRALDLFVKATDSDPATVQEIGFAALAASTPSPATLRRNIALVVGRLGWPSEALRITCVDAYTAERCVVSATSRTAISRAVAASSAVPGIFAPQPIGDRRCMDGGVSGTGTHLDLLAGAAKVVVLALTDGGDWAEGMMTHRPAALGAEIEALEAAGTSVLVRMPAEVDLLELMSPGAVPAALSMGASQADADAGLLAEFWG